MLDFLSVVMTEKGSSAVLTLLKRSGLEQMLDQLFPTNKRTTEHMKNSFISAGQPDIVTYLAGLENAGAKKDIQRSLRISISDENLPRRSSWIQRLDQLDFNTGLLSVLLAAPACIIVRLRTLQLVCIHVVVVVFITPCVEIYS